MKHFYIYEQPHNKLEACEDERYTSLLLLIHTCSMPVGSSFVHLTNYDALEVVVYLLNAGGCLSCGFGLFRLTRPLDSLLWRPEQSRSARGLWRAHDIRVACGTGHGGVRSGTLGSTQYRSAGLGIPMCVAHNRCARLRLDSAFFLTAFPRACKHDNEITLRDHRLTEKLNCRAKISSSEPKTQILI